MPKTKAEFRHERVASPGRFDPRSFRTKVLDGHRIVVGCPKGKWSPRTGRCKIATEVQTILHPKDKKHRANPICDLGKTIKASRDWFDGPFVMESKVKIPDIKGHVIHAGEVHILKYTVPGQGGFVHKFNNTKIITNPGANWFLVIGKFKFDPKRGFVNT